MRTVRKAAQQCLTWCGCVRFERVAIALLVAGLWLAVTGCGHLGSAKKSEALDAQSARIDQQAQEIAALREQLTSIEGRLSRTLTLLKKQFARSSNSPAPKRPTVADSKTQLARAPKPTANVPAAEDRSSGEASPQGPEAPNAKAPEPAAQAQQSSSSDDEREMAETSEQRAAEREAELVEAIPVRAGGVLLPKGRLQLEPQIRYAFSSVNRVEITGYTILPALTLGVIDVTRRDSSSVTAYMSARYGLTDRIELDIGLPFIAGWSSFGLSPKNTDPNRASNLTAQGYGIGDLGIGARYQLNRGGSSLPVFVAGLGARFPTGKSPYEVSRYSEVDQSLEKEIPTGSGFFSLTPTVSFVYPSEPGVLFGNVRYTWNIEREIDEVQPGPGSQTTYGRIDPGDVVGVGIGLGLSLNDKLSISLSYDHSIVLGTTQNGQDVSQSSPLQIGTLGLGATWRQSPSVSYSFLVGIGVTDDAPDVSVGLRVPITFDLY